MKKLIFITIMLLSTLACAGDWGCDKWSYENYIDGTNMPDNNGTYYAISDDNTYSDGTPMSIGKGFQYTGWKNYFSYKAHDISCEITDIVPKSGIMYGKYKSCYVLTLHCDVSERMQFYADGIVTYYDLQGYRNNGTLKWSRDKAGSTDIYCYNKSGLSVVKRVNDPQYCN